MPSSADTELIRSLIDVTHDPDRWTSDELDTIDQALTRLLAARPELRRAEQRIWRFRNLVDQERNRRFGLVDEQGFDLDDVEARDLADLVDQVKSQLGMPHYSPAIPKNRSNGDPCAR